MRRGVACLIGLLNVEHKKFIVCRCRGCRIYIEIVMYIGIICYVQNFFYKRRL